jgi:hypothetical protein
VYRAASAAKSAVGGKASPMAASAYSLVEAGLHVLADKPAIIRREDLPRLEAVLGLAAERGPSGERRHPLFNISGADQWFPACVGTTIGYRTLWPEQAFEEPEPPTREFPAPYVILGYKGEMLEFSERRPTEHEILESSDGIRRLGGYLLHRNADRVHAARRGDRSVLEFHFGH